MVYSLDPRPSFHFLVFRLTVIKAKTRPGIEAMDNGCYLHWRKGRFICGQSSNHENREYFVLRKLSAIRYMYLHQMYSPSQIIVRGWRQSGCGVVSAVGPLDLVAIRGG